MTEPSSSVVRVAATPAQAKVFAALLQAEGIPAVIEGDSLQDEVAASRRLLNLNGTRVLVPTSALARARELLEAANVDEAELTAQALAAPDPEQEVAPAAPPPVRGKRWPLVLAVLSALVFLALWLRELDLRSSARHPFLRYEPTADGLREIRIADGKVMGEMADLDRDGHFEMVRMLGEDGQYTVSADGNNDGRYEGYLESHRHGIVGAWTDTDGDGLYDLCIVKDAAGKELQRLTWVDGTGYVLQPR